MTDHFESPKLLFNHARDHIKDLETRIKTVFDRQPYTSIVERDREAGQDVHKVRLTAKLPRKVDAVAKDALGNLRDTLDHAVYASAAALRPGKTPHRTAFPFANDATGVHNRLNRELIDIPPGIRTFLEGLCPHKTGNQLLWGLNCTRNVKTHRVVVPLVTASTGNSLSIGSAIINGPSQIGYNRWDATKNEVEYMRLGPGSQVHYKLNVSFDVLFGDVEVLGGNPVVGTLNAVASEVESILLGIEAETARLRGEAARSCRES